MTTKDHNPARYISRYLALRIVVKPAYTKEVDGRIVTVQGKDIRFDQGVFETTDQELIDFLEGDKSFGTTYIRVPDDVKDVVKDRGEWMKDLETKERELAEREAALKAREAKVNSSEEGAKAGDGLRGNMPKTELLDIAKAEGVEGVSEETKNADIIAAIRAKREEKSGDDSDKSTGAEGDNAQF
jgi:hypothetical protein